MFKLLVVFDTQFSLLVLVPQMFALKVYEYYVVQNLFTIWDISSHTSATNLAKDHVPRVRYLILSPFQGSCLNYAKPSMPSKAQMTFTQSTLPITRCLRLSQHGVALGIWRAMPLRRDSPKFVLEMLEQGTSKILELVLSC